MTMLYTEQKTLLRRFLIGATPGSSKEFDVPAKTDAQEIEDFVRKFAKLKNKNVTVKTGVGTITVVCSAGEYVARAVGRPRLDPEKLKYPIGNLTVGGSVLIDTQRSQHNRIRRYASMRGQDFGQKFSCSAEGESIRVTRTA